MGHNARTKEKRYICQTMPRQNTNNICYLRRIMKEFQTLNLMLQRKLHTFLEIDIATAYYINKEMNIKQEKNRSHNLLKSVLMIVGQHFNLQIANNIKVGSFNKPKVTSKVFLDDN